MAWALLSVVKAPCRSSKTRGLLLVASFMKKVFVCDLKKEFLESLPKLKQFFEIFPKLKRQQTKRKFESNSLCLVTQGCKN